MSLYVTCKVSRKNPDNFYYALVLDLGYAQKFLSFDPNLCAEVLGIAVRDLHDTVTLGSRVSVLSKEA